MFFIELIKIFSLTESWRHKDLEEEFKKLADANGIKPGELLLPLRIMLVGGKFGPPVFNIAEILGKQETISRIEKILEILKSKPER